MVEKPQKGQADYPIQEAAEEALKRKSDKGTGGLSHPQEIQEIKGQADFSALRG